MTKEELAALLNGMEYGQEFEDKAGLGVMTEGQDDRLVIIYGQSDDLLEFSGAINEELGAWDGCSCKIYSNDEGSGVLPSWETFRDEHDEEDEYLRYFSDRSGARDVEVS